MPCPDNVIRRTVQRTFGQANIAKSPFGRSLHSLSTHASHSLAHSPRAPCTCVRACARVWCVGGRWEGCFDPQHTKAFLLGCSIDKCQPHPTLEAAMSACSGLPIRICGGVVEVHRSGRDATLATPVYELRRGNTASRSNVRQPQPRRQPRRQSPMPCRVNSTSQCSTLSQCSRRRVMSDDLSIRKGWRSWGCPKRHTAS